MNDETVKADDDPDQEPETASPPAYQPPGKRPWATFFILLATLLAVAALLFSGFIYYTTEQFKAGNSNAYRQTTEQLKAIENSVNNLEKSGKAFTDGLNELAGRQTRLADSLQALYQDRKDSSLDWALTEVEYLFIIAIQRLTLEGDVKGVLAIMRSADSRLQDIADPSLLPVRRQLAADINALRAVNEVDISGMGLNLADIITRAEKLPLKAMNLGQTERVETTGGEGRDLGEAPAWRRMLIVIWEELKGLVTISNEDRAAAISLLPEERYYLHQNLRLQLEIARLSLLRRDTANLQAAIGLTTDWLTEYFDNSDAAVSSILETLNSMRGVELEPPLPDINASLEALRTVMNRDAMVFPDFNGGAETAAP